MLIYSACSHKNQVKSAAQRGSIAPRSNKPYLPVFRCFKSDLGFRPIFHSKKERADSHLFITELAYQFVQLIRRRLKESGINANSN
jgi:hypothetical protein